MPIVTGKTARRAHACQGCRAAKHRCEGGVAPAVSAALATKNPDNPFLRELARREAARRASPSGRRPRSCQRRLRDRYRHRPVGNHVVSEPGDLKSVPSCSLFTRS
jgi:hypothetical protein